MFYVIRHFLFLIFYLIQGEHEDYALCSSYSIFDENWATVSSLS